MTVSSEVEVARLRQQVRELSRPRSRLRTVAASGLLVIVLVLTPLAIVAAWTSSILGDTGRYVATVGPLVTKPAVQGAIADRVANEVGQRVDVNALLQQVTPQQRPAVKLLLPRVGNALDNALTSFVQKQTLAVVSSAWFATFWTQANERIHSSMVKALTGQGGGAVQLTNNAVTIDLAPVIDQVKTRLVDSGLSVAAKIPVVHTSFTVAQSENIGAAKTGFRLLQLVGNWLPVLVVLLAALAVWLARVRRRAVGVAAGVIAAGALLLAVGLVVARALYLDKLPAGVNSDAAAAVFDQLVRFLRVTLRSVAVLGIAVMLGAWLAGPGRRAAQVRGLWQAGVSATRHAADSYGMRLGPVDSFVHRWKRWFVWGVLGAGGLTIALWPYPTPWVIVGTVLSSLFALTVVQFLDAVPAPAPTETPVGPVGAR
ncbi:hypothetical protein [Streptacidiphilus monticola]|uniref:Integral membrane protein n=1 Tax=Streptacidiphilus monticola TaxID=2161674 RepID=A0ABW1G6Q9_9ACTN